MHQIRQKFVHQKYGDNLRRLMAKYDMDLQATISATRLSEQTIRGILHSRTKPHPATLDKLAAGFGVDVAEFTADSGRSARIFDKATNPMVREVLETHWDEEFAYWPDDEIDELFSHVAAGGVLTKSGVLEIVSFINDRRDYIAKVKVIFETKAASTLKGIIDVLYAENLYDADGTAP
jgi:transcriptional regulator with XRE-family HTH domain